MSKPPHKATNYLIQAAHAESIDWSAFEERLLAQLGTVMTVRQTPLTSVDIYADYINSATTREERQRRKQEKYHELYGGGIKTLGTITGRLPNKPEMQRLKRLTHDEG